MTRAKSQVIMNKLAIYGAGGHGKVIADAAELQGWKTIHFFDEKYPDTTCHGVWEIVGDFARLCGVLGSYDGVIVAIGNNVIRLEKQRSLQALGARLISIIHPQAIVSPYASIGLGCVVFAGAVVNAFTSIGEAVIINTGASIDHDCVLSDGVHICPGTRLAGNVSVGEASWIGIGSSVIQQVNIANNVLIGAGSVVVRNIKQSGTYFGTPAKFVKN